MSAPKTLINKVQYRIKRGKRSVYMPGDFKDLSDRDQVGRALRILVTKGFLIRLGQGVYVRTRISSITNKPVPEKDLHSLAVETIERLKARVVPSSFERAYNEGRSTQVPTGRVIGVRGPRISRKLSYNASTIQYERSARS